MLSLNTWRSGTTVAFSNLLLVNLDLVIVNQRMVIQFAPLGVCSDCSCSVLETVAFGVARVMLVDRRPT